MDWMRETNEMRLAYSDALIERGRVDERICVVEADLMGSSSTGRFQKLFPERTIDVGVAEANMVGVAAGLAAMGKIPFTHTFTPFATRRCCDQVTLSGGLRAHEREDGGQRPRHMRRTQRRHAHEL